MQESTCTIIENGERCTRIATKRDWCGTHYKRWRLHGNPLTVLPRGAPRVPIEQRFWAKVNKAGPVPQHRPDLGPCWLWTGHRDKQLGYGVVRRDGKLTKAHRAAYEMVIGTIPAGLELDHLCRNRGCVNPGHLEPVTHLENVLRGEVGDLMRRTHCKRGHEWTEASTYIHPGGARMCRTCMNESKHRSRARARARQTQTGQPAASGDPCPASTRGPDAGASAG